MKKIDSKNIQYPPQTGPYKVFVKDKGWSQCATARLQISIGNPRHNGEKFFALTEWAAARYDKVILIVSDTLQRHNLALDMHIGLEEAHKVSFFKGKKWLKDNADAIEMLKPAQRVVTLWDDWISHADFEPTYEAVVMLYATNGKVRDAIFNKAAEFCDRHESSGNIDTSIAYILEELAAFAIMFREKAVDIYPGSWFNEIIQAIAENGQSERLASFAEAVCLRVDFTKNKAAPSLGAPVGYQHRQY